MEPEQFAGCVVPHLPTMVRVAGALVGISAAEDAAQEALVRAWRNWSALRDAGAARSWLVRITVNVCHDWQRGAFGTDRRRTQSLDDLPGACAPLISDADDPAQGAEGLDLLQQIKSLDPDLRAVVALRYYAGMDATEVGQALGIPPATVRTRLKRALDQLRSRLGPTNETIPLKGDLHV